MARPPNSWVWQHFDYFSGNATHGTVRCRLCQRQLKYLSRNGPTNLARHLSLVHKIHADTITSRRPFDSSDPSKDELNGDLRSGPFESRDSKRLKLNNDDVSTTDKSITENAGHASFSPSTTVTPPSVSPVAMETSISMPAKDLASIISLPHTRSLTTLASVPGSTPHAASLRPFFRLDKGSTPVGAPVNGSSGSAAVVFPVPRPAFPQFVSPFADPSKLVSEQSQSSQPQPPLFRSTVAPSAFSGIVPALPGTQAPHLVPGPTFSVMPAPPGTVTRREFDQLAAAVRGIQSTQQQLQEQFTVQKKSITRIEQGLARSVNASRGSGIDTPYDLLPYSNGKSPAEESLPAIYNIFGVFSCSDAELDGILRNYEIPLPPNAPSKDQVRRDKIFSLAKFIGCTDITRYWALYTPPTERT